MSAFLNKRGKGLLCFGVTDLCDTINKPFKLLKVFYFLTPLFINKKKCCYTSQNQKYLKNAK